MTRKEAKEIFDKSSDNAISYHDSTEVISIASAEIIIDKIYEDFEDCHSTKPSCIMAG